MDRTPATGTSEWLHEQIEEYQRRTPQLESFADELRNMLQSAADRYAPLAIVQVRVKAPTSFAQKALVKWPKYHCPIHQLTDLCGGRVIARTRSEVESLSAFIEEVFEIDWANSLDTRQRLQPAEFGYRSIHYVVSLKTDADDTDRQGGLFGFECGICDTRHALKAEIQVRTTVEHAWSDFAHDVSYKGAFELPPKFKREFAVIAAELEDVDRAFERMEDGLRIYAANYGVHLTSDQLVERIEQLELVLGIDPTNAQIGWEIGKLAMGDGDWNRAKAMFERFVDPEELESAYQPLLRDLGVVLCRLHRDEGGPEFARGQEYLELAAAPPHSDPYALSSLADSWRGKDADEARGLYRQAFELDPTDAYPLVRYLEHEIADRGTIDILAVIGPLADRAITRCNAHVSVGMNLPWAYYGKGELQLLMGKPNDALDSYARALGKTTTASMIEDTLDGLSMLTVATDRIDGLSWVIDLLTLALATRFATDDGTTTGVDREVGLELRGPVVIVAGATDSEQEVEMQRYQQRFVEAFCDFEGTVISGGTQNGVSGLVGQLGGAYPGRITTVGYVPETMERSNVDQRYIRVHQVGDTFSPRQGLQAWIDVIASGIDPREVRVLGISGGEITAAEYRIALALGASVGIVQGSGRAADEILSDVGWVEAKNLKLLALPDDPQTLRAFLHGSSTRWPDKVRDRLAEKIHSGYCDRRAEEQVADDPSQAEWAELLPIFQESNRLQADHIGAKLRRIGYEAVPTDDPTPLFAFSAEEIEFLAEMEHGRWNAERLADGWVWGESKDAGKKINPSLVPWNDLLDDVREYDREPIAAIPELLASVGLAIRRIE